MQLVFVRFLEEIDDTKKTFQTYLYLGGQNSKQIQMLKNQSFCLLKNSFFTVKKWILKVIQLLRYYFNTVRSLTLKESLKELLIKRPKGLSLNPFIDLCELP